MATLAASPDGVSVEASRLLFSEQIAFFRQKLAQLVPTARWDDLWQSQHDRAFMVAGVMKADLLADLAQALDRAITEGASIQRFREGFRAAVERHDWHGWSGEGTEAGRAWRTRVIYQTNLLTSYAAGRHAQLREGGFRWWVYHHDDSVLHPRPLHQAWDGVARPSDHEFWRAHYPPNGWGCQCYVTGANTRAALRAQGGDPDKRIASDWRSTDAKTGTPPGIDKGWAYAPGETVTDTVRALAPKFAQWPAALGSSVGQQWAALGVIRSAHAQWLQRVLSGEERNALSLVATFPPELVRALEELGVTPAGAGIYVRPGLVVGPKAQRHIRKGDALDNEEWRRLPEWMEEPTAIALDVDSGNLLYLLTETRPDGRRIQVAVAVNRSIKKGKAMNVVVSAYRPRIETLRERFRVGRLKLITGKPP